LVAFAKFMWLSLTKATHAVVSSAADRKSAVHPDFLWGWWRFMGSNPGSRGFPVEFGGVGEVHAAFLNESRTRGRVQRSVQEIAVRG
jgi:hypothetical protein